MRGRVQSGDSLSLQELEEYLNFLRDGGAVKYFKTARESLQNALVIASLHTDIGLVAMGAIKARRPAYNEKIAERSGWPLAPHKREIGYIAVTPIYRGRGFSKEIVQRLLDFDNRVFGTTSNPAMIHTFKGFGFQREGHEWESKKGATLSLWIKWQ